MNPHAEKSKSIFAMFRSLWGCRELIAEMTKREIIGRYKGSVVGLLWTFINPVFLLIVYSFVFSVAFKARWVDGGESKAQFAVILFAGMTVYSFFSEVINHAPSMILSNVNYVKKVVFPLEILSVVGLGAALFHALIGFSVLLVAIVAMNGFVHWTAFWVVFVLLPLVFMSLGFSWVLSSLGVYLRDLGQIVAVLTSALMFLSPVFYPVSALPESFQGWLYLNPLTFFIEQVRGVLIWGYFPDWLGLMYFYIGSILFAWLGYFWFQKTRKGFSDVL